jgi:hypothetical protein
MLKRRVNLALRYCVTAWLAIICVLLVIGMFVCFGVAMYYDDTLWLKIGGGVGGLALVGAFAFMVESSMVRCLMCGGMMLRPLRCTRHKDAMRYLGSTTLRTAIKLAFFPKSLDCPYCGGHYKFTSDGKILSRKAAAVRKALRKSKRERPPD